MNGLSGLVDGLTGDFPFPRFDRGALRVWERNLTAWLKVYQSTLALNFGEPFMNLLALGFGLGIYVTKLQDVSFAEFIAPGLLASTAMMGVSYHMAFSGHARMTGRVYDSMITGPLEVPSVAGGELLWEATRSAIYGTTFLIVITLMGLVRSPLAMLIPVVMFLSGLVFAAPALWVAAWARFEDQLFYFFTLAVTPMFMFSGIFFPVEGLPAAARVAVWFSPLYHTAKITRALTLGQVSEAIWLDLLWLAGAALVLFPWPVWMLRRRLIS